MRHQGRRFTLVVLCAVVTVLGVGGTASADTGRPTPYQNVQTWEDSQCLAANLRDLRVQQNPCAQVSLQQWSSIPVSAVGGGPLDHILLRNGAANDCVALSGQVANGTKVVLKPCDENDASQIWRQVMVQGGDPDGPTPLYHIVSLVGVLCLDKPEGDSTPGLQLQVWQCAGIPSDWNPFADRHLEQQWMFFTWLS